MQNSRSCEHQKLLECHFPARKNYTAKSSSKGKFMAFGLPLRMKFTMIGQILYNQHSCIILGVHGFPNFDI